MSLGGTVIQDSETLEDLGVQPGSLYLTLRSCAYLVQGTSCVIWCDDAVFFRIPTRLCPDAGVDVVNGYYVKKEGAQKIRVHASPSVSAALC